MAPLAIPYALTPAIAVETRRAQMVHALARGLPRLTSAPPHDRTLYVACYGPSLRDTWAQLTDKHPLIAMSGATNWLAARGIIADYVLEMDPRPSQLTVSLPPVPGPTYLIASCVQPAFFDQVIAAGNHVLLWHTVSSTYAEEVAWVLAHDPGGMVVHAGQTVGIAAVHIGRLLGFSRFEIHGMDGSFADDGARHAGDHSGTVQRPDTTWAAGGKVYTTSQIMANAVAESVNVATQFPIVTNWHGDGLTQALIREAAVPRATCAGDRPLLVPARRAHVRQEPDYWPGLLAELAADDLAALVRHIPWCEALRPKAAYNTGTIPFESAVYLRALCRRHHPRVAVEVGTFIGTATLALFAETIYTCDRSNDCFTPPPDTHGTIQTFPHQTATAMLRAVPRPVDLFFLDGRLEADDLPEIARLRTFETVFVLDDVVGTEKGVANLARLAQLGRPDVIGPPPDSRCTLAVMTLR